MASRSSWVPPAFVYLVKLAAMAAMAACLMLSGVGKSGSPAPKSTTSAPLRRRRSASAETFMVEETLMVEIRSAISAVACMGVSFSLDSAPEFCTQAVCHGRRHELGNVAAERDDLLNHPGADERIFFGGHQENGFRFGPHAAIQQRHLELGFVIGNGADSAQNHVGAFFCGVLDQEAFEGIDFDVRQGGGHGSDHRGSLFDREQGLL